MEKYFDYMLFMSLLAAFIILTLTVTGARTWVQIHGPKLIVKLFSCDFCISFWTCFLLSVILILITGRIELILLGPICTPLTRFLI